LEKRPPQVLKTVEGTTSAGVLHKDNVATNAGWLKKIIFFFFNRETIQSQSMMFWKKNVLLWKKKEFLKNQRINPKKLKLLLFRCKPKKNESTFNGFTRGDAAHTLLII
jgi:hypothetical protein